MIYVDRKPLERTRFKPDDGRGATLDAIQVPPGMRSMFQILLEQFVPIIFDFHFAEVFNASGGVMSQAEVIKLIREELAGAQERNSAYSLRSLSRKLRSSPSVVSEILNGKRRVTKKTGARILEALCVNKIEQQRILATLPVRMKSQRFALSQENQDESFVELDTRKFDIIANWYHFALLSLTETKGFKSDARWVANRLRIKVSDAEKAIETLIKMGLLKKSPAGRLHSTGTQLRTTSDVLSIPVRRNHLQNLDLLRKSLEEDPIEVRDFSSMILTFDPSQMSIAKDLIQQFRRNFTEIAERTPKREVYRLSIQFVPLSKGSPE